MLNNRLKKVTPQEKAKMMEPFEEICIYGPGLRLVFVLHENGTVSDRYENNSCRVSGPM